MEFTDKLQPALESRVIFEPIRLGLVGTKKSVVGFDSVDNTKNIPLDQTTEAIVVVVPGQKTMKLTSVVGRPTNLGTESGIDAVFKTPVTFAEYENNIYKRLCESVATKHRAEEAVLVAAAAMAIIAEEEEESVEGDAQGEEKEEVLYNSDPEEAVATKPRSPKQRAEARLKEAEAEALAQESAIEFSKDPSLSSLAVCKNIIIYLYSLFYSCFLLG